MDRRLKDIASYARDGGVGIWDGMGSLPTPDLHDLPDIHIVGLTALTSEDVNGAPPGAGMSYSCLKRLVRRGGHVVHNDWRDLRPRWQRRMALRSVAKKSGRDKR